MRFSASCTLDADSYTENEIRLVLLGTTGAGTSTIGNSILGKKAFVSSMSSATVASTYYQSHNTRVRQKIVIVDTPGISDTNRTKNQINEVIQSCIGISAPGPHVFILVLSSLPFTQEEQQFVENFIEQFGEQVYEYSIVLFTKGDDLENENESLINLLKQAPENLQNFIKKCGGRTVVFNNNLKGEENDKQVQCLLNFVSENVRKNDGKYYTNEMFIEEETRIRNLEAQRKQIKRENTEQENKKIKDEKEQKYLEDIKAGDEKLKEVQSELDQMHIQRKKERNAHSHKIAELKRKEKEKRTLLTKEQDEKQKSDESNHKKDLETLRREGEQEITSMKHKYSEEIDKLNQTNKGLQKQLQDKGNELERNEIRQEIAEDPSKIVRAFTAAGFVNSYFRFHFKCC